MRYRIIALSVLVAVVVGLIAANTLAHHSGAFWLEMRDFNMAPQDETVRGCQSSTHLKHGRCPIP